MNPAPFVHSALAMTRERRVDTDAFHPMRTFRRHWAQAVAIASHPHTLRPDGDEQLSRHARGELHQASSSSSALASSRTGVVKPSVNHPYTRARRS